MRQNLLYMFLNYESNYNFNIEYNLKNFSHPTFSMLSNCSGSNFESTSKSFKKFVLIYSNVSYTFSICKL